MGQVIGGNVAPSLMTTGTTNFSQKKRSPLFPSFEGPCIKTLRELYTGKGTSLMKRNLRQNVFPFKLEMMDKDDQLTGFGGLPLVHELYHKIKLPKLIKRYIRVKAKGWSESEIIEALVALSIAGGEHMDDMTILRSDHAYQRVIGKKGIPSAKAVERFLKRFHNSRQKPKDATAWVPKENRALQGLAKVNRALVSRLIEASGLTTVTIENDATAVFSQKEQSYPTYKGGTGYMPVVGSIAELGIVVHDEFRDGNVPPGFEVMRFFKGCEKSLPKTVKRIRTRLDGAYYNHDLIEYFNKQGIEFTITAEKRKGFMEWIEAISETEWKPLMKPTEHRWVESGREWAEVHWVSARGTREFMDEHTYRYLVTRRTQVQWEMFQQDASFETTISDRYEVIVTNMDWFGDRLIRWHYERGGCIEQLHDRLKNDLAGGILPCAEFGANAAWWRIQCIAWNLVRALQIHMLPEEFSRCHLKKLRLWLICIAGRVIKSGRQIILKLTRNHPAFDIYKNARRLIAGFAFT